jgi:mannose-6-phosphate isomerase
VSRLLSTRSVAKPWGQTELPPPFAATGEPIGEIWFEPPAELSELLIKYIFTSAPLSVQVHPDDRQAQAAGLGRRGKSECWLIISAEPEARLGIGFVEEIGPEAIRAAALDGTIEHLLAWHAVRPGDFFYIPANTVHAIGAGIGLIEVQQNSDITYRLYDYGRPRELHLDAATAVASGTPYPAALRRRVAPDEAATLVDGPLFRLDQYCGALTPDARSRFAGGPLLVIPRSAGSAVAATEVAPGQCAMAASVDELALAEGAVGLIAQPMVPAA